MKTNTKKSFYLTVLLCTVMGFYTSHAQLPGKISGLKKLKKPKTSTNKSSSSNSSTTSSSSKSPAASSISTFNRHATNLDYCIENKVWKDERGNKYKTLLGWTKTALDDIEKKDVKKFDEYNKKYQAYQSHYDNGTEDRNVVAAQKYMDSFDKDASNMQQYIDEDKFKTEGNQPFYRMLDRAKSNLNYIRQKSTIEADKRQPTLDKYTQALEGDKQRILDEAAAAKLATQQEELNKLKSLISMTKDRGVINDFHRKNLNKLIFTSTPLSETNPSGAPKSIFKLGSPCYMSTFLPKSIGNYYSEISLKATNKKEIDSLIHFKYRSTQTGSKNGVWINDYKKLNNSEEATIYYKIFIDGQLHEDDVFGKEWVDVIGSHDDDNTSENVNVRTTWSTQMNPNVKGGYIKSPADQIHYILGRHFSTASPGTHDVKIEMYLGHKKVKNFKVIYYPTQKLGEGSFKLSFTATEQSAFRKKYGLILPKAGAMNSQKSQIISLYKKDFPSQSVFKCVVVSDRWDVNKNSLDVPIDKDILAYLTVKKNGVCYQTRVVATKEYSGGGKYGATYLSDSRTLTPATAKFDIIPCNDVYFSK